MLTREQLDKAIGFAVEMQREWMVNVPPHGDIPPQVIELGSDGAPQGIAYVELPGTAEERMLVHAVVKSVLEEHGASGYVALFMAWVAPNEGGPPPSEHPNRREIMLVSAGSPVASCHRVYEVSRDSDGKMVAIEPMKDYPDGMMTGLFVDMMGSPETVH